MATIGGSINVHIQSDAKAAQTTKADATEKKSAHELRAESKAQMNSQLLQTTLSLSIKSGSGSLSLLYRATTINIEEALGKAPTESNTPAQPDISAEATANRIVSFATKFFDTYAKQHEGEDPDQMAANFVAVVRGGFEKGFNEAKKILGDMGMLDGSDVEKNIQQTFDLVMKGFDDFLASKQTPASAQSTESTVA